MKDNIIRKIESLIFASEQPVKEEEIQKILSVHLDEQIELETISECISVLVEKYNANDYSFYISQTGGGYQFLSKPVFHNTIASLNGDKFNKKLSATSMETLSIIAYRQPVTKSEIEYIRGVSSDYSIQKLLEKDLVYIQGRKEDAIGKPLLYATTPYLLDYLGINDPSELPQLKEIVQIETVEPTDAKEAIPFSQQNEIMRETGS